MGHSQRPAPLVIGLAGHKGSGKTTIAEALATLLRATVASCGAYVRQQATRPLDAVALADLGASLLERHGPRAFLDETISSANWDGESPLIIEGIRHTAVLDAFRERFPNGSIIFIKTPPEEREERLRERDHLDETTILQLEAHSTEAEVPLLQSRASLIVDGANNTADVTGSIERHINNRQT